jgi:gas vesicle protein
VPLIAWILAGALVTSALVAGGLYVALRRARARAARLDELVADARRSVRAAAEEEAAERGEQLRISISRAHAESLSAYANEERRYSDERRGELVVRERELSDRLAETLAAVERRVEERLRAWEADLERAQRSLEGEVSALEQRYTQRIADVEARIEAEAAELGSTAEHQRLAASRLRDELERTTRDSLAQALDEIQLQADDRRRTIDELNERLRQHEHAVGEQIDHAESEATARIEQAFAELERRQIAELERETAREVDRLSEAGALEFENRMKAIREEAASRLREELDRTTEGFLRRADSLIAHELQQAADAASRELEDRIAEVTRRFEALRQSAGV